MKETFIKSTIILMIGGLITKILGMIIRIVNTRLLGINGMGIYMLVVPTLSLFTGISQFSMTTSISKLVSEDRYNNKRLITSSLFIILLINIILIFLIILLSPFISNTLLKDNRTYLPLMCIMCVLPFEAISSILRGYVFGKNKMTYHVISHIIEQIVRLVLSILVIPILLKDNIIYAVSFLIIVNMLSELVSSIVLLVLIPKNTIIKKSDFIPNISNVKDIVNISLPNTSTRIIGNIGYFLEPIILTSIMLSKGYSSNYISTNYGIISGYVFPILLLPSFFTGAISSALIPIISKLYVKNDYSGIKKRIRQALFFSLLIGIPITVIYFLFPSTIINLLYGTKVGSNYLRILSIPFLLYYIELPLSAIMQAVNKSKQVMLDNLIGIVIKTLLILLLTNIIGIYSLIVASSINILITTYRHYLNIKKVVFYV